MVNRLANHVYAVDRLVVETAAELANAMHHFGKKLQLDKTICVELLEETLSDGSKAYSIGVREAEPV